MTGQFNPTDFKVIVNHKSFYIPIASIVRFEGSENYCYVYTQDGECYKCARTLKKIMLIVEYSDFLRVHKRHVINKKFIKGVHVENSKVLMTNGEYVDISRRKSKEVKNQLLKKKSVS